MLEISVHHMVYNIVSQVLLEIPYKERDLTKGLHFRFDVSLSSYEDSGEYGVRCGLHLVYHAPFNYVTVFSGITQSPFTFPKEVKEWKHECTHDSCWRDIAIFSNLYFENALIVNNKRVEAGLKTIAPKDMSQNIFFDAWNWIPIQVTKDPEDSYRKFLKVL